MRRNFYKLMLKEVATGGTLTTPDGDVITTPGGGVITVPGEGSEEGIPSISPQGYQFYNVQLDRILYYLTCSNGDSLGCANDDDLRAYNI